MKWLWTGIALTAMLGGCGSKLIEKDIGLELPSSSGKYLLRVSESGRQNEPPYVTLRLHDSSGKLLDVFRTDVPAIGKWAIGWAPGEDVLVIHSDAVTMVYNVSKIEKIEERECPQPRYGDIGRRLMEFK